MRSVEASITVAATPDEVLSQFLNLESMRGWWGVERGLVEARAGGVWAVAWGISSAGFHYASTGIIKEYRPGQRLSFDQMLYFNPERPILGPMQISIVVEEHQKGCEIEVRQTGYGEGDDWDWYYQAVVEGWPMALESLKRYVEGEEGP